MAQTLAGLKKYEIFGKRWNDNKASVCKVLPFLCHTGTYFFVNSQSQFNDNERILMSESKFPAGSSVKQLLHFAQLIKDKEFKHYDYGSVNANFKEYREKTPPLIDLS